MADAFVPPSLLAYGGLLRSSSSFIALSGEHHKQRALPRVGSQDVEAFSRAVLQELERAPDVMPPPSQLLPSSSGPQLLHTLSSVPRLGFATLSAGVDPGALASWQRKNRKKATLMMGTPSKGSSNGASSSYVSTPAFRALASLPKSSSLTTLTNAYGGEIVLPNSTAPSEQQQQQQHARHPRRPTRADADVSGQARTLGKARVNARLAKLEGLNQNQKQRPPPPPQISQVRYDLAAEREASERERQLHAAVRAREEAAALEAARTAAESHLAAEASSRNVEPPVVVPAAKSASSPLLAPPTLWDFERVPLPAPPKPHATTGVDTLKRTGSLGGLGGGSSVDGERADSAAGGGAAARLGSPTATSLGGGYYLKRYASTPSVPSLAAAAVTGGSAGGGGGGGSDAVLTSTLPVSRSTPSPLPQYLPPDPPTVSPRPGSAGPESSAAEDPDAMDAEEHTLLEQYLSGGGPEGGPEGAEVAGGAPGGAPGGVLTVETGDADELSGGLGQSPSGASMTASGAADAAAMAYIRERGMMPLRISRRWAHTAPVAGNARKAKGTHQKPAPWTPFLMTTTRLVFDEMERRFMEKPAAVSPPRPSNSAATSLQMMNSADLVPAVAMAAPAAPGWRAPA